MGAAAIGVYKFIILILNESFISNLIASVTAIIIAAIIYFAMVFMLKILSEDEIKQLPAGSKIYSGLLKLGMYNK